MKIKTATTIFEVLASEVRLSIFRLLVKYAPEGLVAGEISQMLDIPKTNLSFHLKNIMYSGLVSMEREGRNTRYRANIPLMLETIAYLASECCSGNSAHCQPYLAEGGIEPEFLSVYCQKQTYDTVLVGALVSAFLLASCSGGDKSKAPVVSTADIENAAEVIKYYNTSLGVLKDMVKEKDVNAVLDYMEQKGKAPALSAIVPPAVVSKDSAIVLNPGNCFNEETRQNLKQNYTGLFQARTEFYANFDTYLSYLKKKDVTNAKKLLDVNYQLSTQMSEYKQNIFDILSPFTEQAELVLLVDNPLKAQIMSVRKMSSTMQSILNLYARKHRMDGPRIDLKVAELTQQLDAAKKLPVVNGHEGEMKSYQAFLSQVETFIKQVKKVREKGEYSDADYDMLTSAFETSII